MSNNRASGPPLRDRMEGKVVVITGASSGLGEAAAHLLPKKGADVVSVTILTPFIAAQTSKHA